MELRNKRSKNGKDNQHGNPSSPGSEEETPAPRGDDALASDTNATPLPPHPKRKRKEVSTKSVPMCRFCKQEFTSPQALGGHMNRHRGEREKEEFQKAEILVHMKGQNFALGYPSGGAAGPSYYQPEANQFPGGGGTQVVMENMGGGGGLQRQAPYPNPNQQQFIGASQMNHQYGSSTHQQMVQPQLPHGRAYVNYNSPCDPAPRPPHLAGGVPQTFYMPRANSGQYQVQGTGSLRDVRSYAMPHGGSSTGVAHHQSNTGFNAGHNLSQAAGGANTPTVDTPGALGTPAGSKSVHGALRQSNATQAVAQFVDQSGNISIPSHFHDNGQAATETYDQGSLQDHYVSQASYAGTSVQYNNAVVIGMEGQYHASGMGMLGFEDAQQGDEFGNGGPDSVTIAETESEHGGGGSSTNSLHHNLGIETEQWRNNCLSWSGAMTFASSSN